jgi:hypothetical protein
MAEQIPRYKLKSTWTAADFVAEMRGELPPETAEYVQARRDALADAGLVDEGEGSNTDDTNLGSADYLKRIQQKGH